MDTLLWLFFGAVVVVTFLWIVRRNRRPNVFLEGMAKYKRVTLVDIRQISPDTKVFVFGLPNENISLGLPIGKHLLFRAEINGEEVVRKYTPTSRIDLAGRFEVPIKIYFANVHPKFPEGGKMTMYLNTLGVGDSMEVAGPRGQLEYVRNQIFTLTTKKDSKQFEVDALGLICGGTGITPCFQLIQYIIDHGHNVKLSLIYANKEEVDILLKERLEAYKQAGKLTVFYTLDSPPADWNGGSGFVSQEMIQTYMPAPDTRCLICRCGPPPMNVHVGKQLTALGYKADQVFKF